MKKALLEIWDKIRIYGLPILAVLGLLMAIRVVRLGSEPRPVVPPLVEPAKNIFSSAVAGAGVVEASGENIDIASHVSGVVAAVHVNVGDKVVSGAPLFTLDDRKVKAELELKRASLLVAEAQRKEAKDLLTSAERVADKRAVSVDELTKRKNAFEISNAKVAEVEKEIAAVETELSRLTVVAPVEGEVLRINIRPGEFAPAQQSSTPIIVLGNTNRLWLRVDVDENNAWRLDSGAPARASLRGNPELFVPLNFVRFERLVTPKRSLTGDNSERVDTRVLQVLYDFDPQAIPVYVGQLMDVYIEAKAHG